MGAEAGAGPSCADVRAELTSVDDHVNLAITRHDGRTGTRPSCTGFLVRQSLQVVIGLYIMPGIPGVWERTLQWRRTFLESKVHWVSHRIDHIFSGSRGAEAPWRAG